MTDNKNNITRYKGKITCDRSILLSIIDLATREICGVSGLATSLKAKIASVFAKTKNPGVRIRFNPNGSLAIASVFAKTKNPGVRIRFNPNGSLAVDVYVRLYYGYSVPDIAYKIQENIKNGISAMVDMRTTKVNVHVMGVDFEPEEAPVSA